MIRIADTATKKKQIYYWFTYYRSEILPYWVFLKSKCHFFFKRLKLKFVNFKQEREREREREWVSDFYWAKYLILHQKFYTLYIITSIMGAKVIPRWQRFCTYKVFYNAVFLFRDTVTLVWKCQYHIKSHKYNAISTWNFILV